MHGRSFIGSAVRDAPVAVCFVAYRAMENGAEKGVEKLIVFADSDGMRQKADELEQLAGLIKGLNYNIEQLVFSTCDTWQGESEQAFAEQIITINGKFDALYAFVDMYALLLKQFADDYESMDTSIAQKIKRI